MKDIAPELLETLQKELKKKIDGSEKIRYLYEKIQKGTATYKDANYFAIEVGELLADTFKENISSSVLPDGKMYYNIADRVIRPMMGDNYELVANASAEVQTVLNKKAGIGIKAIKPKLNEDKVQGIINIVSEKEKYDDIAYMLDDPVVNFMQSVVDDTVKANADFQYKAGMSPKIRRTSTGKCCEWCDKLAGVYEYKDISGKGNNVFRRHRCCRCLVEYDPGDGKVQNVHTKKWSGSGNIEERINNAKVRQQNGLKRKTENKAKRIEKSKEITSADLERMKLEDLRKTAKETAVKYYKSGASGISFGDADVEKAAEKLASSGNRTSLKKDILSMQKKLRNQDKIDIIKPDKVTSGHTGNPKKYKSGMVIDHLGKDGKTETRTFYGESGLKEKDITNHDHNNPKWHDYGDHGEHAHGYVWNADGNLINKTSRNLTDRERKENKDIL